MAYRLWCTRSNTTEYPADIKYCTRLREGTGRVESQEYQIGILQHAHATVDLGQGPESEGPDREAEEENTHDELA